MLGSVFLVKELRSWLNNRALAGRCDRELGEEEPACSGNLAPLSRC